MGNNCAPCRKKSSKADCNERPTFLDDLSDEVLDNVIRHVSASPRCKNWQNHVAAADALTLYSEKGRLAKIAQHHFRALSAPEMEMSDTSLVAEVSTRKLSRTFVKLLEAGGPSFEEINIDLGYNPLIFSFQFYSAFARRCTSVRRLSLENINTGFLLSRLLKPRSGHLEALDISANHLSTAHVNAITKHCAGLLKLSLDMYTGWDNLAPIWRTVGATLTELSFIGEDCYEYESKVFDDAFAEIKEHCVHLSHISFDGFTVQAEESITRLCTSYGSQLKRLRFSDCYITRHDYADIIRACPNVLVDTFAYAASLVFTLEVLGRQVDVIRYEDDSFDEMLDFELTTVAAGCQNITSLIISAINGSVPEMLTAILDSPKPLLEKVEIGRCYGMVANLFPIETQTLELLARRTGSIRHFMFSCEFIAPGTFHDFARANTKLETVEIIIDTDDNPEDENVHPRRCPIELSLASIVEAFSVCPMLQKLVVEDGFMEDDYTDFPRKDRKRHYKEVAEACVPLRNRPVHVIVLGEQYLA